jgi:hypothetical protein
MERAAKNQSLFRDVNERVADLNEAFGSIRPIGEFVCECADQTCVEQIGLTIDEYEALRERAERFAVAPSDEHVFPHVENVVEKSDRYWVVEKFGEAGAVAKSTNPRRLRLKT